jgi:type II secretory pathway pseudopilin PulG
MLTPHDHPTRVSRVPHDSKRPALADTRGFTMIELLVAASIGIIVTLVAFGVVKFTQTQVTRTDAQVHIDQAARVALENLMLELHSGCYAPKAKPIQEKSTGSILRFINARNEAARTESGNEAHVRPYYHEIIFEEAKERLFEKKWEGATENSSTGEWTFSATAKERILATHIQATHENSEPSKPKLPVFRYYRYFEAGDVGYEAGKLNPTTLEVPLSTTNAQKVAKVTVNFSVSPEEANYNSKALEPVALEDSAVYRLTPASTAESPAPQPCA